MRAVGKAFGAPNGSKSGQMVVPKAAAHVPGGLRGLKKWLDVGGDESGSEEWDPDAEEEAQPGLDSARRGTLSLEDLDLSPL